MQKKESIPRAALAAAAPVILGYLTMGIACGVLLVQQVPAANGWWCLLFSTFALSGSMQFAAAEVLKNAVNYSLLMTAVMALLINIRYCIYGLPFLRLFRCYPWYQRFFLIQNLSDETYAIMVSSRRHGRDRRNFMMLVAAFDYASWIAGTVIGAIIGSHLPFPTDGIEFAMVALFVVILVDLCREKSNRLPALIGGGATLIVIGLAMAFCPTFANKSLLLAMALMTAVLVAMRPKNAKESDQ
ncbi:MAG: AzlC family ABC transporter permease [Lentisphaeria bacterium]|nr:AzlC family ABC transporter permease [Lentisphaeria bacterium]